MSNYISIPSFSKFNDVILSISKKEVGSLGRSEFINSGEKLQNYLNQFDVKIKDCVGMNQVHGDKIQVVGSNDKGEFLLKTDGIITKNAGIFLLVKTADCLPVFFYDPEKKMTGVAHLGWKGALLDLGSKMVRKMVKLGSRIQDIYIGVGPSIHSCCYDVPLERIQKFENQYDLNSNFYHIVNSKYYLDLHFILKTQLRKTGCYSAKIEILNICTSCFHQVFFSYRNGDKDNVILGIIGRR